MCVSVKLEHKSRFFFNSHSYSCFCLRNVIRIYDSFEFHKIYETVKERINPKKIRISVSGGVMCLNCWPLLVKG